MRLGASELMQTPSGSKTDLQEPSYVFDSIDQTYESGGQDEIIKRARVAKRSVSLCSGLPF